MSNLWSKVSTALSSCNHVESSASDADESPSSRGTSYWSGAAPRKHRAIAGVRHLQETERQVYWRGYRATGHPLSGIHGNKSEVKRETEAPSPQLGFLRLLFGFFGWSKGYVGTANEQTLEEDSDDSKVEGEDTWRAGRGLVRKPVGALDYTLVQKRNIEDWTEVVQRPGLVTPTALSHRWAATERRRLQKPSRWKAASTRMTANELTEGGVIKGCSFRDRAEADSEGGSSYGDSSDLDWDESDNVEGSQVNGQSVEEALVATCTHWTPRQRQLYDSLPEFAAIKDPDAATPPILPETVRDSLAALPEAERTKYLSHGFKEFVVELTRGAYLLQIADQENYGLLHCQLSMDLFTFVISEDYGLRLEYPLNDLIRIYRAVKAPRRHHWGEHLQPDGCARPSMVPILDLSQLKKDHLVVLHYPNRKLAFVFKAELEAECFYLNFLSVHLLVKERLAQKVRSPSYGAPVATLSGCFPAGHPDPPEPCGFLSSCKTGLPPGEEGKVLTASSAFLNGSVDERNAVITSTSTVGTEEESDRSDGRKKLIPEKERRRKASSELSPDSYYLRYPLIDMGASQGAFLFPSEDEVRRWRAEDRKARENVSALRGVSELGRRVRSPTGASQGTSVQETSSKSSEARMPANHTSRPRLECSRGSGAIAKRADMTGSRLSVLSLAAAETARVQQLKGGSIEVAQSTPGILTARLHLRSRDSQCFDMTPTDNNSCRRSSGGSSDDAAAAAVSSFMCPGVGPLDHSVHAGSEVPSNKGRVVKFDATSGSDALPKARQTFKPARFLPHAGVQDVPRRAAKVAPALEKGQRPLVLKIDDGQLGENESLPKPNSQAPMDSLERITWQSIEEVARRLVVEGASANSFEMQG